MFDILKPLVQDGYILRGDLLRGIAEIISRRDKLTQSDMEDIMRVIEGWCNFYCAASEIWRC